MMSAAPVWSTASWKKSSRLRSLHGVLGDPVWMHPLWMPLTATVAAKDGEAVSAPLTRAKSTFHDAPDPTWLGSPVADAPYQATSITPGDTTSRVGKVVVLLLVDSFLGVLHVWPWSLLYAYLIDTPPVAKPLPSILLPSPHTA